MRTFDKDHYRADQLATGTQGYFSDRLAAGFTVRFRSQPSTACTTRSTRQSPLWRTPCLSICDVPPVIQTHLPMLSLSGELSARGDVLYRGARPDS
jgi:hypothetical protein